MKIKIFACCILVGSLSASLSLFGQAFEVSPYAGFYWPGNNNQVGEFKSNPTLGVRGGVFVGPNLEIGGNYSWINHFQPSDSNSAAAFAGSLGFEQGAVRAHVYEAELTYHFGRHSLLGHAVKPYVVVGVGGLGTNVKHGDQFVLNVKSFIKPCGCTGYFANDVLETGDNFFTFSYGGGVKATRLWGPMGVFGDFRGRAIPNFFGQGTNSPELSGGINFSWGEP